MNMKKLTALLALILALCMLAACGAKSGSASSSDLPATVTEAPKPTDAPKPAETPAPTPEPTPEPIVVTDMTGREIVLAEPAERIVALSAADCEFLFAIGAGDTLVGRGEYCDYPAEVLEVPSVQSGYDTNIEQIVALKPDVLLMSTMAQTEEQIAQLEAAGIAVVVSDAQNIEGVYTALRMIGKLMDREDKAEAVIADMQSGLAELQKAAAAAKAAKGLDADETIYFEVSPLQWGLWAAGGGTFMDEVAELLGLKNIFADEVAWAQISEEQVIERSPDYIITITMYFGEGDTPEQEIASRPGWENIPAVQNGAILRMENNELARPTPRIVDGAQMVFDLVYGEGAQANAA